MTARQVGIIVLVWTIFGVPHLVMAEPAMSRVTVRIYDAAGLNPAFLAAALAVAGTTLASASADVSWRLCDHPDHRPACDAPPTGEFVVRIVRSTTERRDKNLPLGDALVDTAAGAAVLATIYFDRVDRVAQGANMHVATLLGYAVAHEIGHLLLASSIHNTEGLMRPIWRAEELRNRRARDWRFTDLQVAAIRQRGR